ncbi:hypothetical protein NL676_025455 [Syzygium grande]|nr:hypothetical protein NL676_025455 [Syzygium grande]
MLHVSSNPTLDLLSSLTFLDLEVAICSSLSLLGLAMAAVVLLTRSGREEARAAMIGEVDFGSFPSPPPPKLRSHAGFPAFRFNSRSGSPTS